MSLLENENTAPDYEETASRFRPIFARIAAGAVAREKNRELPYAEVEELRAAGFGALRVPRRLGGFGVTIRQFFALLTELAAADSNVSHLLRGHFAFTEGRLNVKGAERPAAEAWLRRIAEGTLIGYAMAEQNEATGTTATIVRDGDGWLLNGKKYYSTGTLYADWIIASVLDGEARVGVALPATAEGVTRLDDWDGFGQRLTASGTTIFENVRLPPDSVVQRWGAPDENGGIVRQQSYQKAFLQLVLLSSLAGIARAVLRDGTEFVRAKTRTFGVPGKSSPRHDPLVQRVVGRLASLSYSVDANIESVSRTLDELHRDHLAVELPEERYLDAEIRAFEAQQIVIGQTLEATTLLFEVGGASATSESRGLDRYWRNARTAASHNPAIRRECAIGDWLLNGAVPDKAWHDALKAKKPEEAVSAPAEAAVPEKKPEPVAVVA